MSDCPEEPNDRTPDAQAVNLSMAGTAFDAQSLRDILMLDDKRKAHSMNQLTDDFGRQVFSSPWHLNQLELTGIKDMAFRDRDPIGSKDSNEGAVHRLNMAGDRWGDTDLASLAAVSVRNLPGSMAPTALFQLDRHVDIGASRCDRIADKLGQRQADDSQENSIKLMLSGVKELKELTIRAEKAAEGTDEDDNGGSAKSKRKDRLTDEDFMTIKLFIEGDGESDGKSVTDWAEARLAAEDISDANLAEKALDDLIKLAEDGNPYARDLIAGCMASGDRASQAAWLAARRKEQVDEPGARTGRIRIPTLPPQLADKLKGEAARALIKIGKLNMTRSENVALAICLGHALKQIVAGNQSDESLGLRDAVSEHFINAFKRKPKGDQSSGPEDRRPRRNAINAVFDAVRAGVPGFKQLIKFVSETNRGRPAEVSIPSPVSMSQAKTERIYVRPPESRPSAEHSVADATPACSAEQLASEKFTNGASLLSSGSSNSLRDAYQTVCDRLRSGANTQRVQFDTTSLPIKAGEILAGRTQKHINAMLRDTSLTWQLSGRKTLTISDQQTLVQLDSGRLFDPMTNAFYKLVGSKYVQDDKSPTAQEKAQVSSVLESEHIKAIMRNHLALILSASMSTSQFLNSRGSGPALGSTVTAVGSRVHTAGTQAAQTIIDTQERVFTQAAPAASGSSQRQPFRETTTEQAAVQLKALLSRGKHFFHLQGPRDGTETESETGAESQVRH